MGHAITAIILKGNYDKELALTFDLKGVKLGFDLQMFFIDHYYSACWQEMLKSDGYLEINENSGHILFPNEVAIAEIVQSITQTRFAQFSIIVTDYFGGVGTQYAQVYQGQNLVSKTIDDINGALQWLGVVPRKGMDAFDTVGLSEYRSNPDYLDKYADLSTQLGV
ncbi:hypothetical protein BKI52_38170 [marine bacterium AO1-C]|nr:hypothetical protein BKI52_38170 [marine bacterium AO1-C]